MYYILQWGRFEDESHWPNTMLPRFVLSIQVRLRGWVEPRKSARLSGYWYCSQVPQVAIHQYPPQNRKVGRI